MLTSIKNKVRKLICSAVTDCYEINFLPEAVKLEYPQDRKMGDIAVTVGFDLAKVLKKAPRIIASELVDYMSVPDYCSDITVAGAGYINIYLNREKVLIGLLSDSALSERKKQQQKIIVEHTNINPNKAAHIGHLRNAVMGDVLVQLLSYSGAEVEVQNFIDDTGVQVADIVVGFVHIEKKSLKEVKAIKGRLDYYCWELYSKVSKFYAEDNARLQLRAETLRNLESGNGTEGEMGRYIAQTISTCHLKTMEQLGITYHLLPKESDILGLDFWDCAFEKLKSSNALYFADDEKKKGCWVMKLSDSPLFQDMEEADKILVRSNGTVTYTAKDIAYQMWKFGILGKDFCYEPFYEYDSKNKVWTTSVTGKKEKNFGKADKVYNVIDVRQSYLQSVVKESLRILGFSEHADNSIHFSYEMVALSPSSCLEMGISLSEEEKKKDFIEMSGRKGIGVKADDLVNTLILKATEEVRKRNEGFSSDEAECAGKKIAMAALRYFMIKFTKNKLITFDFDEVLSFEGETGPYLQYSVVRAENIFRKLSEKYNVTTDSIDNLLENSDLTTVNKDSEQWNLLYRILSFDEIIDNSIASLELSYIAKYAYSLARDFNSFYHNNSIINEQNNAVRSTRVLITVLFLKTMKVTLSLLGIEIPDKM